MIPSMYYSNLFAFGVLSGSNSTDDNPVRRIADGSINLEYQLTSGAGIVSGVVEVILSGARAPDGLVLSLGVAVSGHRFILESEDVGGGNNATILDFTLSGADVTRFVQDIVAATKREVWRLTVSGTVTGLDQLVASELQLAFRADMPRSNQVGVDRARKRQFTRTEIPGGQPFVMRTGPRLRRTRMSVVAVSGAELNVLTSFVDAIEGGQSFTFIDDLGQQMWAEMPAGDVPFPDQAGVYTLDWTFQEVDRF